LSVLAIVAAAPALAAPPTGSLSGQDLTNSVGAMAGNSNRVDVGSIQNAPGSLLPADELGGTTSGVPLLSGADPAKWNLKQGLGDPLVMTADIDLKAHGHPEGLAGLGVDPNQITEPLAFEGVMPQANAALSQAGSAVPAVATGFTSLLGLGGH
jgi:hypothetical protein